MSKPKIGFIGLGIMGLPMAKNLLKASYSLVVHNRSRQPVRELVAAGAEEAFSSKEVAQKGQFIITMLPDSPDVESVALGSGGLIEGVSEGDIYVDMSTIAPGVAIKVADTMAKKGVRCLDAPVSGGDVGAINATLSIMVGGDEETFNEATWTTRGSSPCWRTWRGLKRGQKRNRFASDQGRMITGMPM